MSIHQMGMFPPLVFSPLGKWENAFLEMRILHFGLLL